MSEAKLLAKEPTASKSPASKGQRRKVPFKELIHQRQFKRRAFVASILIPLLVWFFIFMFLPIVMVVIYSFTNAHMAYPDYKFVGLHQYIKMFTADPILPIALRNTVMAVLYIVPTTVILSVLLANGLNAMTSKWQKFYTFVYFLPSVLSAVAISLVWKWLYHQNYGLINAMLGALGLPAQGFINSASQALICYAVIQIWSIFGYYAVILLAAIQGIDPSLYEAADIDGANGMEKFFKITVPLIKQNILFVCIMATINGFMIFTPIQVLTEGKVSPGTSTMVLMMHIMKRGINNSDIGYASAMSLLLMSIILVVSVIQSLLTRERKPKKRS